MPIDYDALAKQAGAISSQPAQPAQPDYDALAKQAGAISSTPAPAPSAAQKSWMDSVGDYFKGFWGNLAETGQGMVDTVRHPIDTAASIGKAQDEVRLKAEDAFKRGDYATGVRHVINYLIPMAGPAIDAQGDEAQSGRVAHALGGATALGLQLAGPGALERTVPKPVTPPAPAPRTTSKPIVKSGLNPVQQEAVDFLQGEGVHLPAETLTGNKFVKGASALAANSPLGAPEALRSARATETGLTRVAGNLAEEAYPRVVTPESAGEASKIAVNEGLVKLADEANAKYERAWAGRDDPQFTEHLPVREETVRIDPEGNEVHGMYHGKGPLRTETKTVMADVNMPVDVRSLKTRLQPILDELDWMPASDKASSAGYQAIKKILTGPDFIPAWQAEHGLSGLKTMARVKNVNTRNYSEGLAANIVPELQEGIDAAVAKTGPEAIKGLQSGRATWATHEDLSELAKTLRDEPVQAFNQQIWRQDTGIEFLRRMRDSVKDVMPQIGRAYIQQLFDKATKEGGFAKARTLMGQWEDLGPETKKILFPDPLLRNKLDKFFMGAKMVGENVNPSGTAVVGQLVPGGMLVVRDPISGGAWLIGGYAASKLLFSPKGVTLLTKGVQSTNPRAASMLARQIVQTAGKGATPVALSAVLGTENGAAQEQGSK